MEKFISFLLFILLSVCSCFSPGAFALSFDKIIVFGDSLSDNGNIYRLTTAAQKVVPLIPIIPKNPPYFNGRFSNGPVWVDNLGVAFNVPVINYAYGGAWVEPFFDSKQIIPFSVGTQIDMYLATNITDFHKKNHLYIIWAGGNDYLNGRNDPDYATTNTVHNLQNQIDWLIFAGARKILILNLPDLGRLPYVVAKGPYFAQSVSQLSTLHNQKLDNMITHEMKEHTDVTFISANVPTFFNDMIKNPLKYHLTNVTSACYDGGYLFDLNGFADPATIQVTHQANINLANNSVLRLAYRNALLAKEGYNACSFPDEYFFWDQIHPSRAIHQIVSAIALEVLNNH